MTLGIIPAGTGGSKHRLSPRPIGMIMMVAGLLSLVIGIERFVNAMLIDGVASYTSTRFVVAVACVGAGSALLVLDAVTRPHRRQRRERGRTPNEDVRIKK